MNLPRPVFYSDETVLNSHTLYISTAEKLPSSIMFMEGSALICISTPSKHYFNDHLNLLVIDDSQDIFNLSNMIHNIYDSYESWYLNLQQSIRQHQPLQHILDITEHIFGNGLSIMNSDYYIVARTSLTSSFNKTEETGTDEFGRLHINQVNSFKNDKAYQKIKDERNVFIYPENILPFRTLCKNIFLNEEFIYRIVVFENVHEFTESDMSLLDYLTQCLIEDPEYLIALNQIENIQFISLLQNIIIGNAYSQIKFNNELKRMGWSQKNVYCIAHILPSSQDIYNATLTYFCNKIMHDFKHTFAFTNDDNIIVIINLSRIKKTKDEYFTNFNHFVREGNFRVGYSDYSKGLSNLKEYFCQAGIALTLGTKHNPTMRAHQFCDYVLIYMLNKITEELPAKYLYSPILSRLYDYDRENNTEYVQTLQMYLKNNMNALQTAKDLYIHRATIVYRLERIKEISKTDFKNADEMLHLYISLKLLNSNTYVYSDEKL
ncbi:MAG: PucR family transcriptional regulator [Eubacteriaceae bacterium]